LSAKDREAYEKLKRDFIKIEDLEIGDGPIAAWNRKLSADIEVRYTDGALVYQGPVFTYEGFFDPVGRSNRFDNTNYLWIGQDGIRIGLHGMRVGGQRHFRINPMLVCSGILNNPQTCPVTNLLSKEDSVRKQTLVMEAVLKESCISVFLRAFFLRWELINWEVRCRDSTRPRFDPKAPIWRFYD